MVLNPSATEYVPSQRQTSTTSREAHGDDLSPAHISSDTASRAQHPQPFSQPQIWTFTAIAQSPMHDYTAGQQQRIISPSGPRTPSMLSQISPPCIHSMRYDYCPHSIPACGFREFQPLGYLYPTPAEGYRQFIRDLEREKAQQSPLTQVLFDPPGQIPHLKFKVRMTTGTLYNQNVNVLDRAYVWNVDLRPFDTQPCFNVPVVLKYLRHVFDHPEPTSTDLRNENGSWQETARQWVRDAEMAGRLLTERRGETLKQWWHGSTEAVEAFHEAGSMESISRKAEEILKLFTDD